MNTHFGLTTTSSKAFAMKSTMRDGMMRGKNMNKLKALIPPALLFFMVFGMAFTFLYLIGNSSSVKQGIACSTNDEFCRGGKHENFFRK